VTPKASFTIEKSNWSGCGLVVPRALLGEAKQRKELSRTGVYVLTGPPQESGLQRVYIGEGDPVRPRLEQHAAKKDFWTQCIAFTSKDENLNKAHVQFLEARLVALATAAKRCVLDNGNAPLLPSLSESDSADANGFLSEMLLCLPVLGLSAFAPASSSSSLNLEFSIESKGVIAHGKEAPEGFLVLNGSHAVRTEVPSCHGYLRELRAALQSNEVLRLDGDHLLFVQDYLFASPSTAAGVVLGRAANGRTEWRTRSGATLKDVQEAREQ
jgi:hypothetical protein